MATSRSDCSRASLLIAETFTKLIGAGLLLVLLFCISGAASTQRRTRMAKANAQLPGVGLAPAVTYSSGGQLPSAVVVADVNGDHKPDLLVVNTCPADSECGSANNGSVGVLLGNGDGTFQPVVIYGSGGTFGSASSTSSLAIADTNGDGKLDLLVANNGGSGNGDGVVAVLLGNGDGTFQPAVTYDSGGIFATSVSVADVDGDGKLDLLVSNQICTLPSCVFESTDGSVGVLLGNGDGTFQPAVTYDAGNGTTSAVVVADLSGDEKLDLVVADACEINPPFCEGITGVVGVLLGNGDGTFQPVVTYYTGGWESFSLATVDVNGDGKLDVLVANSCNTESCQSEQGLGLLNDAPLGVLLGKGDGTLQAVVTYDSGGYLASSVAVADVNGDGKLDLITDLTCASGNSSCGGTGFVSVLPGNGDGTFQTAVLFGAGGTNPQSVAVTDLNGDGKPDVVVSICTDSDCAGGVAVLLNVPATTTALVSSANPSVTGQTVTLTATVTPQGKGTLTGTVNFLDGTTSLGKSTLNNSGVATLSLSALVVGNHSITAAYSGDADFGSSSSPVLNQVVRDFSLGAGSSTTQTVTPGQAANYSVTVSSGLSGSVTFSCSGEPAQSTCTVTPNPLTLEGPDSVTASVAVVTTGATMGVMRSPGGQSGSWFVALGVLSGLMGMVLMAGGATRHRRGRRSLLYFLGFAGLLAIGMTVPGCGGGGGSVSSSGTPAGTYTLTVSATFTSGSAKATRSTDFTLVVK